MDHKIALCFLTYDNLSRPDLWQDFLKSNSNYNVYIHNKNNFEGYFSQYCIDNIIETEWGKLSLVKATLNLFREAFKDDTNKYFILLSDKCIPLYNANEIYKKVNCNLLYTWKLQVGSNEHTYRVNTMMDKNYFDISNFYKQNQWMILNRDTVKYFIENDYTHIFGENNFIPDESYFVNILKKNNIKYVNNPSTYVNFEESSDLRRYRKTPKTYSILTDAILRNILNTGTLFMRKIGPDCVLPSYFMNLFPNCNKQCHLYNYTDYRSDNEKGKIFIKLKKH